MAIPRASGAAVHVVTDFGDFGAPGQLRTLIGAAVLSGMTIRNGARHPETGGGAILNFFGTMTISGNRAFGHGGGIFQSFSGRPLTLSNVTIAGNTADRWGGGLTVIGTSRPSLVNTIVAANRAGLEGADCFGTFYSQGYNLVGETAGCSITGITSGNVVDTDAHLLPLGAGVPARRRAGPREVQSARTQ